MTAYKTNNKTNKSTRKKELVMKPEELLKLRQEIRFDKASLARNLSTPYRTLQDYESGARPIPAAFADKVRTEHTRQLAFMADRMQQLEQELDRTWPRGIPSEIKNIPHDDFY